MSRSIKAIVYQAHGKPEEVLRLDEQKLQAPAADEALVRVLAAPVNPADLNQSKGNTRSARHSRHARLRGRRRRGKKLEGRYKAPPSGRRSFCRTTRHVAGSVRSEGRQTGRRDQRHRSEQAAMLKINPLTAWRMLHDFVVLQPGDWVIKTRPTPLPDAL